MCSISDGCAGYEPTSCDKIEGRGCNQFEYKQPASPGPVERLVVRPGLNEAETKFYDNILRRRLYAITQEEWDRWHRLNDKMLTSMILDAQGA